MCHSEVIYDYHIRKRNNKYQVQVRVKSLYTSATLITLDNAKEMGLAKRTRIRKDNCICVVSVL